MEYRESGFESPSSSTEIVPHTRPDHLLHGFASSKPHDEKSTEARGSGIGLFGHSLVKADETT
jgi:hypothetical protein